MNRWGGLVSLLMLCLTDVGCANGCSSRPTSTPARLDTDLIALTRSRDGLHASGLQGDLRLRVGALSMVVSTGQDVAGHRPLRGAIVDVMSDDEPDTADMVMWIRPGVVHPTRGFEPAVINAVDRVRCDNQTDGVEVRGVVANATFQQRMCASSDARITLRATISSLESGSVLADEIHPGSSQVIVDQQPVQWEGDIATSFVSLVEHGAVLQLERAKSTPAATSFARRNLVKIGAETFPALVTWRAGDGALSSVRTLSLTKGHALTALSQRAVPETARQVHLEFLSASQQNVTVELLDGRGASMLSASMQTPVDLSIPVGWGSALRLRDGQGVVAQTFALANSAGSVTWKPPQPAAGKLHLVVNDESGQRLAAHVLLRGLEGASDPLPVVDAPDFAQGRSVYLTRGENTLSLAPGKYHATVTHGLGHTLFQSDVVVRANQTEEIVTTLKRVIPSDWISADFHLHAAPSPDSTVTLTQRVQSLLANGVEFAVATDHNRVTDYSAALASTGASLSLGVMAGVEITTAGKLWGHFNAFPMRVAAPTQSPESAVPPYYQVKPADIFSSARQMGARVIQVNHARMPPSIGYFDLTGFDASRGTSNAECSFDFDAFEAFNGIWIETPERVREGYRDVVGLARAGHRTTVTGNSDSHQLLFEEAGYPRTYVHVGTVAHRDELPEAVLKALRDGRTVATSGALVMLSVQGAESGALVRPDADGTVLVHVRVVAPAWVPVERVSILRNDDVVGSIPVARQAIDGVRAEGDLRVVVGSDSLVTAWVDADASLPDILPYTHARAIAFATPVAVDADADGKIRVAPASP